MQDSRARGRRTLLIVAAVFLVPVAVAFTLYYGKLWRPANSSSKGELIEPARPLDVAGLRHADGTPAGPDVLAGKWTLIYIGDGALRRQPAARRWCSAARRRLALNNEMTRVQRVFLATGNCCDTRILRARAGRAHRARRVVARSRRRCSRNFPPEREHTLFIVDPLGNLMMRHDASHTTKDLLSDLKKLLKLSHIG